jgi:hypothetical protein
MSVFDLGSWSVARDLPGPIGLALFGSDPLRHSHRRHRQEQNPAGRQYRDDYCRLFGRAVIEAQDDWAACANDPSRYEPYVHRLGFWVADGLTRGCAIESDYQDHEGCCHGLEVITWPGLVVRFQLLEPGWCYSTDFFTHKSGHPHWRGSLTARVLCVAERAGERGRALFLQPRPEYRAPSNEGRGYRTNIRFLMPDVCGFARRYFDLNTCPPWNRPE